MRIKIAFRTTTVALFAALLAMGALAEQPGTWTKLAPVPAVYGGVEGMSVGLVGNKIIAALGYDRGAGDTATTRIYDIDTNTWSFGANAPGVSSEGAGVAHGGLFYVAGGRRVGSRDDLWAYDIETNSWTALAPMNQARTGLALVAHGNSLYAIGGRTTTSPCGGGALDSVERYDIDTNTWTNVAPMPFALSDRAAAVVGGKIYVFGGCHSYFTLVADVDVYDPVTDTWSDAPADLSAPRSTFYTVAAKGGKIFAIGGWDGVTPGLSTNDIYDVARNRWSSGTPMPTPRAEAGSVSHGGRIYVLGGAQPHSGLSVAAAEAYKP